MMTNTANPLMSGTPALRQEGEKSRLLLVFTVLRALPARGPLLPLPRAFPSPSGCRLPVPRVLVPRLMNILTEANAAEVN